MPHGWPKATLTILDDNSYCSTRCAHYLAHPRRSRRDCPGDPAFHTPQTDRRPDDFGRTRPVFWSQTTWTLPWLSTATCGTMGRDRRRKGSRHRAVAIFELAILNLEVTVPRDVEAVCRIRRDQRTRCQRQGRLTYRSVGRRLSSRSGHASRSLPLQPIIRCRSGQPLHWVSQN